VIHRVLYLLVKRNEFSDLYNFGNSGNFLAVQEPP